MLPNHKHGFKYEILAHQGIFQIENLDARANLSDF